MNHPLLRRVASRSHAVTALLAAAVSLAPALASAHDTGTENSSPSQCSVLSGTALHGPQADCLRCIGQAHYHFHPELPLHQRCHNEHHNPVPHPSAHAHAHHH